MNSPKTKSIFHFFLKENRKSKPVLQRFTEFAAFTVTDKKSKP